MLDAEDDWTYTGGLATVGRTKPIDVDAGKRPQRYTAHLMPIAS